MIKELSGRKLPSSLCRMGKYFTQRKEAKRYSVWELNKCNCYPGNQALAGRIHTRAWLIEAMIWLNERG